MQQSNNCDIDRCLKDWEKFILEHAIKVLRYSLHLAICTCFPWSTT